MKLLPSQTKTGMRIHVAVGAMIFVVVEESDSPIPAGKALGHRDLWRSHRLHGNDDFDVALG